MKRFILGLLVAVLLITSTGVNTAYADEQELVIVLDPGHDSTHAGAGGNGVREEKAVLKIALYLKEELSKYQNVTVYMTREGEKCAFPGTITDKCNEARVSYAESVNADVLVSLHLNSFTNSTPHGAIVYVQNDNYSPEAGKISQNLGTNIVNRLAELGLKNGGIFAKTSTVETHPEEHAYPDGSFSDYYRVLRYAKKVHMPAIIVEHAFLSNPSDAALVLKSEDGLKALALKDAQGIVDYYGLTLKEGCVAGELPNIEKVPETQQKPTPEPEPQPTPPPTPTTETESEVETETEEETETQLPEETESETEEETETQLPDDDASGKGEPDEFPWGIVAIVAGILIVGGVAGAVYYQNLQKRRRESKNKG